MSLSRNYPESETDKTYMYSSTLAQTQNAKIDEK